MHDLRYKSAGLLPTWRLGEYKTKISQLFKRKIKKKKQIKKNET